jgi:hypothetical protein
VTTRVFTDEDLERLRSFPTLNPEELIRFFTLTPADVEFIDPGRGRGERTRWSAALPVRTGALGPTTGRAFRQRAKAFSQFADGLAERRPQRHVEEPAALVPGAGTASPGSCG